MRTKTRIIFIALLLLTSNFYGQDDDITPTGAEVTANTLDYSVPFLTIAPDSRGGALGDAGVATSADINSIHWNPSKYSFMEKDFGLAVSYTPWLRNLVPDIYLAYLTGYYRLDKEQVISGSLRYFSLGEIMFTDEQGNDYGQHIPNEFAVDAAYSRKFSERFSGGIAFRYIRSDLTGGAYVSGNESKVGNAVAADVSMYYKNPYFDVGDDKEMNYAFGINIRNIGSKISYSDKKNFIPTKLKLGGAATVKMDQYNSIMFTTELGKLLVPTPPVYDQDVDGNVLTDDNGERIIAAGMDPDVSVTQGIFQSFYDAPGGFEEEMHEIKYSLGLEYWYQKVFAIRTGYFNEHESKGNRKYFTVGVGLKLNVFEADFSYVIPRYQNHPLGNTMRFTLALDFEALKKEQRNQ